MALCVNSRAIICPIFICNFSIARKDQFMRLFLEASLLACFGMILSGTAPAQEIPQRKKLIEWGSEPTTSYLRVNIDKAEQMPFDGVVFPLRMLNGTEVTWKMWGGLRYEYSILAHMVRDLTQTPFKSIADRFIRVNVTPGNVDWFDDRAWGIVLHNFSVAAKVAKAGKCKGFVFDLEQYEGKLFDLATAVALHGATQREALPEEYHAKVRQRGRELIAAISSEFPTILILFPWAYQGVSENNLLSLDFLNGIFEAAPPQVRLVDAGEGAYKYKYSEEFQEAYKSVKFGTYILPAATETYRAKIEAGFGIWIDADWDKTVGIKMI